MTLEESGFDGFQLFDFRRILPVVRQIVVFCGDPLDLWYHKMILNQHRQNAGRVGLKDEGNEIEHGLRAANDIR